MTLQVFEFQRHNQFYDFFLISVNIADIVEDTKFFSYLNAHFKLRHFMETYIFILFATLAVASAVGMIASRDTVNSALFLVLNLISVAGIFLLLKAQFLAVVQVLVYGGAIMVLFLFVIMLLNLSDEEKMLSRFSIRYTVAFFLGVIVLAQLLYAIASVTGTLPQIHPDMEQVGTVESIGDALFTVYMLPVLVTAILLTAAIVGALLLAQRKISEKGSE